MSETEDGPSLRWPKAPPVEMIGRLRLPKGTPVVERILARLIEDGTDINDRSGCWVWSRHKNKGGYGTIGVNGATLYIHRVLYQECVGAIPPGFEVDHRCHVEDPSCVAGSGCQHRACCNPAHLRAISGEENRGYVRGPNQGRCETGEHEFDPATAFRGVCRGCYNDKCRERNRAWRSRKLRHLGDGGVPKRRAGRPRSTPSASTNPGPSSQP